MTASASCRRCLQQLLPGMMVLGLPLAALAAGIANVPPVPRQSIDAFSQVTQLAQSWADEYFYGIGNTNNLYVPTGIDPTNCPAGSVPKVNQSYIWGMAKSGDDIYFGTLANANVVVSEVYLGANAPSQSFSTVQETTNSYYGKLHGGTEDWRPPQLFRYNIPSHTLTLLDTNLPAADFDALQLVGGIRAGGATPATKANPHRMVMLAGIAVAHDGLSPTAVTNADGLTFFLFDATTMRFVAHAFRPQWTNIRRFAELNGDLYFGVQKPNVLGGAVVRWVNNPAAAGYPFAFQEVGNLDNMGADICIHQGQLFVSTWPGYVEGSTNQIMAAITNAANLYKSAPGIWRSPTVPATGLTTAHANQWQKIWSVANYEPDVVTALTLGCGALASFDGYLYFGTIQVPLTGYVAHNLVYPYNAPTNTAGQTLINANTQRATSLFRAHNFRAPVSLNGIVLQQGADVELLYGNTQYPTWVPSNSSSGAWVSTTNLMGQAAAMGPAGFGNPNNVYTWSMATCRSNLYVGVYNTGMPAGTNTQWRQLLNNSTGPTACSYGGDLYRLSSSMAARFVPVTSNGMGDIATYGFRTMVTDSNTVYIGTANPRNLFANPTNGMPWGGWELLALTHRPGTPFDVDGDLEGDAAWTLANNQFVEIRSKTGAAITNNAGSGILFPAWADYDADGIADPAFCNPATGVWTVWFSSRNGQPSTLPAFASSGSVPVPADFDGDGKADPALCTTASGKITWRGTLTGKTYSITPAVSPAGKAFLPAIGDYNGDGVSELVWYVPPTATVTGRIVRCTTTTVAKFTTTSLAGSFKGVPVPADYDGDGTTDFAINDPTTGLIRVWPSSAPGTFVDSPTVAPGLLPMVADYDGDGKADFAWYNPTSGIFRIISSRTSATDDTDTVAEFGIPTGSRPVAAPAAVWYTK